MKKPSLTWMRWMGAAGVLAMSAISALDARAEGSRHEEVGVSCADCPDYQGAYSIENNTGVLIHYQYRWGNKHPWKKMALASGRIETHRYPLGEDPNKRIPTPYVRFDHLGGDNAVSWDERRLAFHAVGYAGYGPKPNLAQPMRYAFKYAPNGRDLSLVQK